MTFKAAHSKYISWLLRHGAGQENLPMDEAGWTKIEDLCQHSNMSKEELMTMVESNSKKRFELKNDLIRASQGHSLLNMPITQQGLEESWTPYMPDHSLWHGTSLTAIESIAKEGIFAQQRSHVHLSQTTTSPTGKRDHVAVMLEIDPRALKHQGYTCFITSNHVVLVRQIPLSCIIGLQCMTKRARRQKTHILSLFPHFVPKS